MPYCLGFWHLKASYEGKAYTLLEMLMDTCKSTLQTMEKNTSTKLAVEKGCTLDTTVDIHTACGGKIYGTPSCPNCWWRKRKHPCVHTVDCRQGYTLPHVHPVGSKKGYTLKSTLMNVERDTA
jgi:hypothetical protein